MKRTLLAASLLLASQLAAAVCYLHPNVGGKPITYCYYASECPSNTTWRATDQQCVPNDSLPPPPPPETDEYGPAVFNTGGGLGTLFVGPAIVSRNGRVVTVTGDLTVTYTVSDYHTMVVLYRPDDNSHGRLLGVVSGSMGESGTVRGATGVAVIAWKTGQAASAATLTYTYTYIQ